MKKLLTILKSLFSNQAVLDLRTTKWYITLIVFIFSVFLPWIPYLSSGYTANAASLLTATGNYEVDKGFKQLLVDEYFQKGITIKQENNVFTFDYVLDDYVGTGTYDDEYNGLNTKPLFKSTYTDTVDDSKYAEHKWATSYVTNATALDMTYYYDNIAVDSSTLVDTSKLSSSSTSTDATSYETGRVTYLEAYYLPSMSIKNDKHVQLVNNFVASVILGLSDAKVCRFYPHSYVLFGSDFITIAVYSLKSTKSSYSAAGSYSGSIDAGVKNCFASDGSFYQCLVKGSSTSDVNTIYKTSFCDFMHQAGRPSYLQSTWLNIAIISGVTVGAMLVAAVALFIFSKRKTSVYRDTTFFQAVNEGVYITVCPAIITMAISFFSTSYSIILMLGCTLMRVVFIMSRICPPPEQPTQSNKPLYQARS